MQPLSTYTSDNKSRVLVYGSLKELYALRIEICKSDSPQLRIMEISLWAVIYISINRE
uniref:Uncharacterized protein n=1 Tax=Trichogramma kaykai TaxID=54128 RepID=A0ABD2WTC1_9HYME